MEYICPEIEQQVSCYTCDAQSLPPLQLCKASHVNCRLCTQYMQSCACGDQFDDRPHVLLDWMVSALKLKCKYRAKDAVGPEPSSGADVGCPVDRWYAVHELHQHYRSECLRNLFPCPWESCDHITRIDTAVDHYEAAHGPFEVLTPTGPNRCSEATFKIPLSTRTKFVLKIFNGYLLFAVKRPPSLHRRSHRISGPRLTMRNMNPADSLRYTHCWRSDLIKTDITITVSITKAVDNS